VVTSKFGSPASATSAPRQRGRRSAPPARALSVPALMCGPPPARHHHQMDLAREHVVHPPGSHPCKARARAYSGHDVEQLPGKMVGSAAAAEPKFISPGFVFATG